MNAAMAAYSTGLPNRDVPHSRRESVCNRTNSRHRFKLDAQWLKG